MSYLTTLILLIIYTQIPSKMKKSNLFLIFSLWGCAQTDMKCSWKVSQVHAGDKIGFSKPLKLASLSQFCLPCELEKIFHSHFISVFSQPKEKILRTKYYCFDICPSVVWGKICPNLTWVFPKWLNQEKGNWSREKGTEGKFFEAEVKPKLKNVPEVPFFLLK